MNAPYRLAAICSQADQPVALSAAQQLANAVSTARGAQWAINLTRCGWEGCPPDLPLLLFLSADASTDQPVETVAERWHERLKVRQGSERPPIFLVNLYRCVTDPSANSAVMQRIRRLNLLAVELSRAYDVEIVDIDWRFALVGMEAIGSDFRCLGARAALIAGHSIAVTILSVGLDAHLPADVQQRALAELQQGADLRERLTAL